MLQDNGYLLVRDFLSAEQVEQVRAAFDRYLLSDEKAENIIEATELLQIPEMNFIFDERLLEALKVWLGGSLTYYPNYVGRLNRRTGWHIDHGFSPKYLPDGQRRSRRRVRERDERGELRGAVQGEVQGVEATVLNAVQQFVPCRPDGSTLREHREPKRPGTCAHRRLTSVAVAQCAPQRRRMRDEGCGPHGITSTSDSETPEAVRQHAVASTCTRSCGCRLRMNHSPSAGAADAS
ncbi:hypothetical protein [Dactylosporangium matsuzakiense]|uniref:Phytanoyl-CoA dioxygenase n=1 Tax=Dactylosporangium matsuzakiense TaxID=53360 RepID=A0A9W6KTF5_9ACTN|nr:hypothetical protein [Dactylosporangium matsuzakiense]GLL07772.1 hypothetical protein GCM10017581_095290 [Dactylosporangium matsuzakiense]